MKDTDGTDRAPHNALIYVFRTKTVEYIIILASQFLSYLTKLVPTYRLYAFGVRES